MEDIFESISNEICEMVKRRIIMTNIFRKPDEAIIIIQKGKNVLDKWKKEFEQTKRDIEEEQTVKRWDFQKTREIFAPPIYMKTVLCDIEKACTIIQEFYAILGPDLKQVTGDSDKIDMETDKVKDEVRKLENFNHDIFNHKNESRWKDLFQ